MALAAQDFFQTGADGLIVVYNEDLVFHPEIPLFVGTQRLFGSDPVDYVKII